MPRPTRTRLRVRLVAALLGMSAVVLVWPQPLTGWLRTLLQVVVPLQHTLRAVEPKIRSPQVPLSAAQAATLREALDAAQREAAALAARVQTLQAENEALAGLRRRGLEGVLIPALVVAHDSVAYRASGLIDRGRLAGVVPNQQVVTRSVDIEVSQLDTLATHCSVLAGESLIGEIVDVTPYTARVLLITDPASRLRLVRTARRTPQGTQVSDCELMLYGAGQGLMQIRDIEYRHVDQRSIQAGDLVLTDSGDARLHASIDVGRITELQPDDENPALYTAVVEPAVDLSQLKKVYVVKPHSLPAH